MLKQDFHPPQLAPLLDSIGFEGCVSVQARQNLEETRWLLELADQSEFIRGVVGWVDLRSPEIVDQLKEFAVHPKLVGVRHVVHDEPEDDFVLGEAFRNGIAQIKAYELTYDLLLFPRHIPYAVQLVEEFPEQTFILDHIAKPDIAKQQFSPWREEMEKLASFPNVACKLSGMVTEAEWQNWKPEDFHPYIDIILDLFGPSRTMIGSDWPVCTLSGDYASVMNIVIDVVSTLSPEVRDAVLGQTCATWYNLPTPK